MHKGVFLQRDWNLRTNATDSLHLEVVDKSVWQFEWISTPVQWGRGGDDAWWSLTKYVPRVWVWKTSSTKVNKQNSIGLTKFTDTLDGSENHRRFTRNKIQASFRRQRSLRNDKRSQPQWPIFQCRTDPKWIKRQSCRFVRDILALTSLIAQPAKSGK